MPGLIGAVARTAVVAGTWTAVGNRVARRQQQRWAEKDQVAYSPQPVYGARQQYAQPQYVQQAPPPPAPPAEDPIEQIQKLAKLRDSGAITEEEFTAAKAKALGI